jgi:PAS domain S-box-containing protein
LPDDQAGGGGLSSEAVTRRHEQCRVAARSAGVALVLIAGSVLAGWWTGDARLKSGMPGFVAMNPVTAINFILAGFALCLLVTEPVPLRRRRAAQAAAACLVLLALLCLSRLYTPWDLGVDRLLFPGQVALPHGGLPNRMAPNTGLNFVLLGSALLLLDYRTRRGRRPAEGLASVAGVTAFFAAAGYVYGSSLLYGIGAFIPMAVNTAVGFLVLSAGILCARPGDGFPALFMSSGAAGMLARRLLPAAFLVPLVLGWLRLGGQEAGLYDSAGGVALTVTGTTVIIALLVWRSAVALDRSDAARSRAERSLRELNEHLELRVAERTEEVRRAGDELRALFEASPLAICGLDPDGRVRSWNRAAEELFGWSADEVIGTAANVPADLREEFEGLRARVLAGGTLANFETRGSSKDGRAVEVSVSAAALRDRNGTASGVVLVYADVSARKTLEAQLRQAQKMEAVGRLAGGVAHDFNNILTVIRAAAEFLLTDLDEDDARRSDAAEIRDAANRAAALTRQLLAFSRQQVLQMRVVDLNAVVTGLEPMVRRVLEANIAVVTRLQAGLNLVRADPHQLDQVILNLVVNARDAMPEGGTLLIETANVVLDEEYPRSHRGVRPGPHVVLSVTDTGCGMDAATQARAFEPFFTTKPVGQGTGLGLATVYGIVRQSGGHLWVYSEVGRGTTFKVYFPCHTGPADEEAKPPVRTDGREALDATILLVEDDVAVRATVRRVLERGGYSVLEAPNGDEALASLADPNQFVHLVISDMVMPGMSGLELRENLREARPGLPVLLMSGYSEEAIARFGDLEAEGPLIEKPFTVQGILDKVQDVLAAEASEA